MSAESVMYVGSDVIGIFVTNKKVFYRDEFDNTQKDWTAVSYLVLSNKRRKFFINNCPLQPKTFQ